MLEVLAWAAIVIAASFAAYELLNQAASVYQIRRAATAVTRAVAFADDILTDGVAHLAFTRLSHPVLRIAGLTLVLSVCAVLGALADAGLYWVPLAAGAFLSLAVFRQWHRDEAERDAGVIGRDLQYSRRGDLVREALLVSLFALVFSAISIARMRGATLELDKLSLWPVPEAIRAIGRESVSALPIVSLWPWPQSVDTGQHGVPDWATFLNRAAINLMFLTGVARAIRIRRRTLLRQDYRGDDGILRSGALSAAKAVIKRLGQDAMQYAHAGALKRLLDIATGGEKMEVELDSPAEHTRLRYSAVRHLANYALASEDHSTVNAVNKAFRALCADNVLQTEIPLLYREALAEHADFLLRCRNIHSQIGWKVDRAREEAAILDKLLLALPPGSTRALQATRMRLTLTTAWLVVHDTNPERRRPGRKRLAELRPSLAANLKTAAKKNGTPKDVARKVDLERALSKLDDALSKSG